MEEELKNQNGALAQSNEERTFTQSEVEGIVRQYNIKINSLQKELQSRDLNNFYQTLSILFEIVRCKDAYSAEFVEKCTKAIEGSINSLFDTETIDKEVKENEQ